DVPAEAVRVQIETGRLAVGSDPAVLGECDAVFICVPTPFTQQKEPDVRHISEAAAQVARWGRPGQLVVLRSTSYPGTTEEVVRPALEGAGRVVGRDVFLAFAPERIDAFAPERIDPGNTRYGVEDVPVVGGCDPSSARLVPMVEVPGARLTSQPLSDELVARADCVLILTDHSCVDYAAVVRRARLVLDVRNATAAVTEGREKIVRL
ncbi:MAG: hypothetical protein QN201_06070, partial [Armatimonadota bacterium]|nr:hypothetical protein [Armatimonadota bacterium]